MTQVLAHEEVRQKSQFIYFMKSKKAFLNLLLISLINFLEDFYFAVKLHVGLINARNLQLMHITHVFTQKSVEKLDIGKLDNTLISAIDENFFVKKQLLNS